MYFREFFDLNNKEHLKALKTFQKTKAWPKDFLPPDVFIESDWYLPLVNKIIDEYLKFKLKP